MSYYFTPVTIVGVGVQQVTARTSFVIHLGPIILILGQGLSGHPSQNLLLRLMLDHLLQDTKQGNPCFGPVTVTSNRGN